MPLQTLRWRSRTEVFVERIDGLALPLVRIPAGAFLMGSPPEEPDRRDNEGPQHRVQLTEFLMGQTPVTQAQWRQVAEWSPQRAEHWTRELNPNPSRFNDQADRDNRPVETVSWHDAIEFCHRLSQRSGRHYSLPSEAQWEYACRAGMQTPFHFGETITPELANYNGTFSYANGPKGENQKQTTPVGMFPANAWGLQDMHGNVLEWCRDHWHGSYEGAPSDGSAWLNASGSDKSDKIEAPVKSDAGIKEVEARLLRGGSWGGYPGVCRSANRDLYQPGYALYDVGFRVVCLPQDPSLNT